MLYDPKWNETKADPFTLESLIAWLEKQPALATYSYVSPFNCMLCQYFGACGFANVQVAFNLLRHSGGDAEFPWQLKDVAQRGRRTFGAALQRARALSA